MGGREIDLQPDVSMLWLREIHCDRNIPAKETIRKGHRTDKPVGVIGLHDLMEENTT
jgi:hypothetical protein